MIALYQAWHLSCCFFMLCFLFLIIAFGALKLGGAAVCVIAGRLNGNRWARKQRCASRASKQSSLCSMLTINFCGCSYSIHDFLAKADSSTFPLFASVQQITNYWWGIWSGGGRQPSFTIELRAYVMFHKTPTVLIGHNFRCNNIQTRFEKLLRDRHKIFTPYKRNIDGHLNQRWVYPINLGAWCTWNIRRKTYHSNTKKSFLSPMLNIQCTLASAKRVQRTEWGPKSLPISSLSYHLSASYFAPL